MITSSANSHIKTLRKLWDLKERRNSGLFLAEGLRVVGQAFESKANLLELIYSNDLLVSEYGRILLERAGENNLLLTEVSSSVFNTIARKEKPQGLAAVIKQNWQSLAEAQVNETDIWVALQAVQNPGNLGTIMRTCDAVGVAGLILMEESTDPYDPSAVKASMGSIFTVPHYKSDFAALMDFLQRNPELKTIGTSDKAPTNCFTFNYPKTTLLLMGSERQGLPDNYFEICDQILSIPMQGACDSLNLSVATGVVLYQLYQSKTDRI